MKYLWPQTLSLTNHGKAHLAALAANIIFAANFTFVKIITPGFIGAYGLNVARVAVSVILFWSLYMMNPSTAGINRKYLGRFIICAATGVAINQMLFVKGLSLTTSIHAALLMLASPIFITLIAAWLLREKLEKYKVAGMLVGISGAAYLISIREDAGNASNPLLGDILVVINAISYAFYMVLVRPLMKQYTPVHVIRWVFTIGLFMILPIGWNEVAEVDWAALPTNVWASLAFVIIAGTFFAYLFTIYSITHNGASVTGNYIYTQPFFASGIAMIFLGETFTWPKAIAGLLILGGVLLVNQNKQKDQEPNLG